MPHAIFIREHDGDGQRPPEMIAYDIASASVANRLVRSIARSHGAHGFDRATGRRWFRSGERTFEIYRFQQ